MFAALPFLVQGSQSFVEIPMRLEDHAEVLATALKKELERRHPIKDDTVENDALHTSLRQILHQ